jgi:hypothetical protein
MSQTAKKWLARQGSPFVIHPDDGGIVGSLIGLNYVKKEIRQTKTGPTETGKYVITPEGEEWTKHQNN